MQWNKNIISKELANKLYCILLRNDKSLFYFKTINRYLILYPKYINTLFFLTNLLAVKIYSMSNLYAKK